MPDSAPLIVNHPAVADRLARLRDASTPTPVFRRLVEELGQLLAYEATRALPMTEIELQTPVALAKVHRIATRPVVAPILRAGLGLLPGFLAVVDDAVVAHLGFYRDPKTLAAIPYYANLPDDLASREVFVLDPMLATGHSGSAALATLAKRGAKVARVRVHHRGARRHRDARRGAPRRAHRDRRRGRAPERSRLHRAGPGRRRRPDVRLDELGPGEHARGVAAR